MLKRFMSGLLVVVLMFALIPGTASAAGVTYFQTVKADVPIWSAASSSSTKLYTISSQGTVLKITGSTVNSSGNTWYQIQDGTWVFSGNVTGHSHSYSGGICTGRNCGYEYPLSVYTYNATMVVTNGGGAPIWSRPYSNNSSRLWTASYGGTLYVNAYTVNKDGNTWYRLTDGSWVFSGNVGQYVSVSYNANGGTGAPGSQSTVSGQGLTLSSVKPTRVGYRFQHWTNASGNGSYAPGGTYYFSSSTTLYASWASCSHSYSGGICSACGYEYPLSFNSYNATVMVTNPDGASIWSRPYSNNSIKYRVASKGTTLTVTGVTTNQAGNKWYQLSDGSYVFSDNVVVRYTITYNANGGTGAPGAQTASAGASVTLSKTSPKRVGYIFQGWATSSSATSASYKGGSSVTLNKNLNLYAVWTPCSHSYSGGTCSTCGYVFPLNITAFSATVKVTKSDGAKIWSTPYSTGSSVNVRRAAVNEELTIKNKTVNSDGNTWYQLSDGNWIYSKNVTIVYTITYRANGGTGAPGAKSALAGTTVTLSKTSPKRVGYIFQGWATSSSATSASYKGGSTLTLNKNLNLYAVWAPCSHSYSGGTCSTCGYVFPLNITAFSATVQVTKSDGAKVWNSPYSTGSSVSVRRASVDEVLTIKGKTVNADGNTWYQLSDGNWIYSNNVTRVYTITYRANGGTGAPGVKAFHSNTSVNLSTTKPRRVGYNFQGWATSSSATSASYQAGASVKFTKNITLYAVWKECDHNYQGGVCTRCAYKYPLNPSDLSGTFVVTNDNGAKIWSIPYSTGSSVKVRTEKYNAVLTVTKKVVNAVGSTWYQLSDGNWVYSGNVTQRFTVTYNANGGTGAPGKQTFLSGKSVTISKTKPTRPNYIFTGWATSTSGDVKYKGGETYSTKKSRTLYAMWLRCQHSTYSGGYCTGCGKEFPLDVQSLKATFVVTNADGCKVWSRPYSSKSTTVRTESKGAVLNVTGKVINAAEKTWYKLSDGNWVYSGNVKQQYTITYNANGGTGAPSKQTFVKDAGKTLSSKTPTRTNYVFLGWATSSSGKVIYGAGAQYTKNANVTLYAVWGNCTHSYNYGICTKCGYEWPYSISSLSARVYRVNNTNGSAIYARPYSKSAEKKATLSSDGKVLVVGSTVNKNGAEWYKLQDGNWIKASDVTYSGTMTYNHLYTIKQQWFEQLKKGTINACQVSGVWYYQFSYNGKILYVRASAFTEESQNTQVAAANTDMNAALANHAGGNSGGHFIYNRKTKGTAYLNQFNLSYGTYPTHTWVMAKVNATAGFTAGDHIYMDCTVEGNTSLTYHEYVSMSSVSSTNTSLTPPSPKKPSTATEYVSCLKRGTSDVKLTPVLSISVTKSPAEIDKNGNYYFTGYMTSSRVTGTSYENKSYELKDYVDMYTSAVKVIKTAAALVKPEAAVIKGLYDLATEGWKLSKKVDSSASDKTYDSGSQPLSVYDQVHGMCRVYRMNLKSPLVLNKENHKIRLDVGLYKYQQEQEFSVNLSFK